MVPSRTGQIAHEVHGSSSSATDHRISFTNWQKGNCLGSGSYCTVHVGFTENLKCANILIDVNGSLKLADFGLVKETLMSDMRGFIGSPYWMAPELIMNDGKGWNEVAADIWSLGCTILEMSTRKIPYSHLELFQALYNIGYGRLPEIPSTLSEEAQSFILKCLQVNPDDRPTTAELLEHPFVKESTLMNPGIASPNHSDNVSTET